MPAPTLSNSKPTPGTSGGRRELSVTPVFAVSSIRNYQSASDAPPETIRVNNCRLSPLHIDLDELVIAFVKWGLASDTEAAEAMVRRIEASATQLELDFGRGLLEAAGLRGRRGRLLEATQLDEIAQKYAYHWEPKAERFIQHCKAMLRPFPKVAGIPRGLRAFKKLTGEPGDPSLSADDVQVLETVLTRLRQLERLPAPRCSVRDLAVACLCHDLGISPAAAKRALKARRDFIDAERDDRVRRRAERRAKFAAALGDVSNERPRIKSAI